MVWCFSWRRSVNSCSLIFSCPRKELSSCTASSTIRLSEKELHFSLASILPNFKTLYPTKALTCYLTTFFLRTSRGRPVFITSSDLYNTQRSVACINLQFQLPNNHPFQECQTALRGTSTITQCTKLLLSTLSFHVWVKVHALDTLLPTQFPAHVPEGSSSWPKYLGPYYPSVRPW